MKCFPLPKMLSTCLTAAGCEMPKTLMWTINELKVGGLPALWAAVFWSLSFPG